MNYPAIRRQRFQAAVQEAGLDGFLVTNPLNVHYLTGFTGDSSFVIIGRDRTILVSDTRFSIQIGQDCPELETAIRSHNKTTWQEAADVVTKLGFGSCGIEAQHLSVANFDLLKDKAPTISFVPKINGVESLRAIKDDSEIEAIRAAIGYGHRSLEMLKLRLAAEDSEKKLADALDSFIRQAGGRGTSFETIVAVGDRSALPHALPTDRKLAESPFFLLDWGAMGPRYTSDLTRMIRPPFASAADRARVETQLEKIYTVVLRAQERAIAAIHPGATAPQIDAAARSFIEESGYGKEFNHGLGHGIGLQVHEAPDIRSTSSDVLRPGMVLTIEPGIYIPGFGGVRLEDDILVTPDGHEVLSAAVGKEWETI